MDTFNFNNQPLRHVELDGEPWFMADDVCRCLGLKPGNDGRYTYHTNRLGADERRSLAKRDMPELPVFTGTVAWVRVVSESGLYKLIMRSDKDTARPFQDWVTKEVLPAIRRTGGYLLNEAARETAHADTREAMPLPQEVLDLFKQMSSALALQTELLSKMMDRLDRVSQPIADSPKAEEAAERFTKDYYTAREVAMKLRLAGAMPTNREFNAIVVRTGQQLSVLSRQMNQPRRMVERYGYPTACYHRSVIEAFAAAN